MSKSINNPNKFGTNDEPETSAFTPSGLTDDTDFPHTGLFKSLNLGIQGNYVVSGFNISAATASTFTVAAGKVMRDGSLIDVNTANLTLSTSYTNGYHLLVAPTGSSPVTPVLRNPTAANKVPDYTAGDTIIAIVAYVGSTGPLQVQYLTNNKTENSLSLGYDNSGYTETGTLTADANGITMTGLYKLDTLPVATVAGSDKILLQDADDSDIIKTATASSIAGLGSGLSNVVDDTTPQLGGTLESNGNLIKFGDSASATDDRIFFGAGDDLGIWHDGAQSHIYSASRAVYLTGGGNLYLRPKNGEDGIILNTDGAAEIYHDDTKVIETISGGAKVIGDLEVSGVQYQQFQDLTDDLAVGWYSIALIEGQSGGSGSGTGGQDQRGIGTFLVRNTDSSRHQTIMLTASHLFGGGNGNGISVEHSSYFSTLGITQFRLKEASTYDGAALQIYIADATNNIEIYLKNNFQEAGWQLIQAVADGTDPSTASLGLGYNNSWVSFNAANTTEITGIAQLGQHIQGHLTVKSIRTSDYIEINGDLDHDGSNVGFYGTSPASKQTVGNMGTSAVGTTPIVDPTKTPGFEASDITYLQSLESEISNLRTKMDALIDALQLYGLIS